MKDDITLADKARAAGLDDWTIRVAYLDFESSHEYSPAQILEAHHRVCIHALCHDNPIGNVVFPLFGAGVVRV